MEDFSTPRKRLLPGTVNVLTLAALVWITWWSAQQRPALPSPSLQRPIGAAIGTGGQDLQRSLSGQPGSAGPRTSDDTLAAATLTAGSAGDALFRSADPASALPAAASPSADRDPLSKLVGYRSTTLTAGAVGR